MLLGVKTFTFPSIDAERVYRKFVNTEGIVITNKITSVTKIGQIVYLIEYEDHRDPEEIEKEDAFFDDFHEFMDNYNNEDEEV